MEEKGGSRTGQATALARARLDRPHTPGGDPDAQQAICRGMEPLPASSSSSSPTNQKWGREHVAWRTRFFDQQVLDAIAAGISQVVICGAGYDDRALRFREPGVEFFELDHPLTQVDKKHRLEAMNADMTRYTLAPADFQTDDVAAVLESCGHDAGRPSVFLCEGLLVFFDGPEIIRFLAGLVSRAAPGSRLSANVSTLTDGHDSAQVVAEGNANRAFARETEPWQTIQPRDVWLALLKKSGWRVEHPDEVSEMEWPGMGYNQLLTAVV
jgi:methyltransferase (TIGR00027 family)